MRAFERDGLVGRVAPFVAVTVVGLVVVLTVGPEPDTSLLLQELGFFATLCALVALVPWHRLPRWTDVLPALAYLLMIVSLRRHLGSGLTAMTVAPFFLVPTFWVALHGTRVDLVVILLAVAGLRFGPGVARGFPTGELGYALPAYLVWSTVCAVTHRTVERSREGEAALRAILDRLPIGFAATRRGEIAYANEHLARTLGHGPGASLVGSRALASLEGGGIDEHDATVHRVDGGELVLQTRAIPIVFERAPAVGLLLRDVSDERLLAAAEREWQETIARERERLAAILATVEDGVAILDEQRVGVYANDAYLQLFGLDRAQFEGLGREAFVRHVAQLSPDPDTFVARFADLSVVDGESRAVFELARPRRRVLRRIVKPLRVEGERGYLVVWHDVTADHDLGVERERLASLDPLTGVLNRRGGDAALTRELARARRAGTRLSVVMLDIDRFKDVNDQHGHDAGDAVLRAVAAILTSQGRSTDTAIRWGGEEFLVVLPGASAGAIAYCDRVRAALAAAPVPPVGVVTISAGIAEHADAEELDATIARADARLYEAKRAGRNRVIG